MTTILVLYCSGVSILTDIGVSEGFLYADGELPTRDSRIYYIPMFMAFEQVVSYVYHVNTHDRYSTTP
jgi:hypothetical protein